MDVLNKFLSKDGRLSRKGYVLCFVVPGAALLATTAAAFTTTPELLLGPGSQVFALSWLAFLSTMDAQNIRRYHDLGSAGGPYSVLRPLLVILPILAFALQFLIPAQLATMGDMGALAFLIGQEVAFHMTPAPLGLMALWFVGLVSNIAYLSIMPGNHGPNPFGGDPLQGGGAPANGLFGGATGGAETGDPVERALGEYRASLAQPKSVRTPVSSSRPQQAGATFGKKR